MDMLQYLFAFLFFCRKICREMSNVFIVDHIPVTFPWNQWWVQKFGVPGKNFEGGPFTKVATQATSKITANVNLTYIA